MVEPLYEHYLLFQHGKVDYCSSMIIFSFRKLIIYFLLNAVLQMLILLMLLEILLG